MKNCYRISKILPVSEIKWKYRGGHTTQRIVNMVHLACECSPLWPNNFHSVARVEIYFCIYEDIWKFSIPWIRQIFDLRGNFRKSPENTENDQIRNRSLNNKGQHTNRWNRKHHQFPAKFFSQISANERTLKFSNWWRILYQLEL